MRARALGLVLALCALLALWLLVENLPVLHWIAAGARLAHRTGATGAVAVAGGIYFSVTLLFVPIIPLVLACGWLYGIWGVLVALPAALASAATSFSIARALGRSAVARALGAHPKAQAIAELAEEGGALTVALLRIAPIFPFTPGNAALGLTGLKLRDLILGTVLGMAPGMLLYAWTGSLLPSAEALERREALPSHLFWFILLASIAASVAIGIAAARRLRGRGGRQRAGLKRTPPERV